jgi:hypothetical protein
LNDPSSLVSFQSAIKAELVLEDPFASDDVGFNGPGNEILGVVGDQGIKFFFHCATPIRISELASD